MVISGAIKFCAGIFLVLLMTATSTLRAAPSSAILPGGIFNYDANTVDSPYVRTTNYYGFDKVDADPNDRWTNIFGDFKLPLLANAGIGVFYDDNVLNNNLNKHGSFGTRLTPSITLPFGSQRMATTVNYAMRANIYENLSYANTVSNYLNASTSFEFDHRNHMVLTARGTPYAQDPLGTYFSQGSVANTLKSPNTYSGYGFDANYQYGAEGAKGRIIMNFAMNNREYSNNPEYTYQRDMNSYSMGGAFLWRVMPKTQVAFEVMDTVMDYMHPLDSTTGAKLNGSLYGAYTGLTWEPSTKTRAVIKGGCQIRTYDYAMYGTLIKPGFQGMLAWSPRSRDHLWLDVSNFLNESFIGTATTTYTQNYMVNWSHSWSERFNTSLGALYMQQEYSGISLNNNTINARVNAVYTFRPGVWADLAYTYTDRTSTQSQYEINRNMVLLNLRVLF